VTASGRVDGLLCGSLWPRRGAAFDLDVFVGSGSTRAEKVIRKINCHPDTSNLAVKFEYGV